MRECASNNAIIRSSLRRGTDYYIIRIKEEIFV